MLQGLVLITQIDAAVCPGRVFRVGRRPHSRKIIRRWLRGGGVYLGGVTGFAWCPQRRNAGWLVHELFSRYVTFLAGGQDQRHPVALAITQQLKVRRL